MKAGCGFFLCVAQQALWASALLMTPGVHIQWRVPMRATHTHALCPGSTPRFRRCAHAWPGVLHKRLFPCFPILGLASSHPVGAQGAYLAAGVLEWSRLYVRPQAAASMSRRSQPARTAWNTTFPAGAAGGSWTAVLLRSVRGYAWGGAPWVCSCWLSVRVHT